MMQPVRSIGIIPARMAATRLPGKPLVDIAGVPMLQRVWERARAAELIDAVFVATPDLEIRDAALSFGCTPIMTSDRHRSGTDRLAEAVQDLAADIIVNIQGDEPLLDPSSIDAAVRPLQENPDRLMTSLMARCPEDQLDNPATVKVVCRSDGSALYFSRARLPFARTESPAAPTMQHIGLYAYRREFLIRFSQMAPTPLEQTEMLEQLRALENGVEIQMVEVPNAPLSVDTPEDLEIVRRIIRETGAESA